MVLAPPKIPICDMIIINSSHGSQTYSNHMESQCLINTTNFIKNQNHFNHFSSIFSFFNTCDVHFIATNILWNRTI